MASISKLRQKLNNADSEMQKNIGHLGTLAKDAERVSNIAKNASSVINDIDRKFEEVTKLTSIDISFLFLSVALQVARQYLVTNFKVRRGHKKAADMSNFFEDKIKKAILGNDNLDPLKRSMNWYNPLSMKFLITLYHLIRHLEAPILTLV